MTYELRLASGKTAVWEGTDGEAAARRYVESHPDQTVLAYRRADRHGFYASGDRLPVIAD